jgi:hypothetical protein
MILTLLGGVTSLVVVPNLITSVVLCDCWALWLLVMLLRLLLLLLKRSLRPFLLLLLRPLLLLLLQRLLLLLLRPLLLLLLKRLLRLLLERSLRPLLRPLLLLLLPRVAVLLIVTVCNTQEGINLSLPDPVTSDFIPSSFQLEFEGLNFCIQLVLLQCCT